MAFFDLSTEENTETLRSMFSFGYFPGVWGLKADISEPSIGSIFLGRFYLPA